MQSRRATPAAGLGQAANPSIIRHRGPGHDLVHRGRAESAWWVAMMHRPPSRTILYRGASNRGSGGPPIGGMGDDVRWAATVILAMGDGRRSAHAIDAFLRGEYPPKGEVVSGEKAGAAAE